MAHRDPHRKWMEKAEEQRDNDNAHLQHRTNAVLLHEQGTSHSSSTQTSAQTSNATTDSAMH